MISALLNPFIESVHTLCSTMLKCEVQRGRPAVSSEFAPTEDITALIGLSGPARGTVALSFPAPTAHAMVGRLLQIDTTDVEENVVDGVAELVNIVAGSAKAKLHDLKTPEVINLGLPTVIQGGRDVVHYPKATAWLDVPFQSDLGPFHLRVTFERNAQRGEGK